MCTCKYKNKHFPYPDKHGIHSGGVLSWIWTHVHVLHALTLPMIWTRQNLMANCSTVQLGIMPKSFVWVLCLLTCSLHVHHEHLDSTNTHVLLCTHMQTHTHVRKCTHTSTTYINVCSCMNLCVCIHICLCIRKTMHNHVCVCINICAWNKGNVMCTHPLEQVSTRVQTHLHLRRFMIFMYTFMHVRTPTLE
jgi:hypothetical protein